MEKWLIDFNEHDTSNTRGKLISYQIIVAFADIIE